MKDRHLGFLLLGALALSSSYAGAQAPTTDAIVAQFYPQSLVGRAATSGRDFERKQCYAVIDALPSGAPRTIVAAYTNQSSAAIRVLQANGTGGFEPIDEPQGYQFAGDNCEVKLADLDNDGRNEVVATFNEMMNTVSWVFRWDGQHLINMTPVTAGPDGVLDTDLYRADIVDIDNDGIKEIFVVSQYPPPSDEPPLPNLLYRLQDGRYVQSDSVVGLWEFDRATGAPRTDRVDVPLPQGALGPYTLHVVNGGVGGKSRVSSAQVWVNDDLVLGPADFGQNVPALDRSITLTGDNTLAVRLASVPGSKILIILKSERWQ